MGSIGSKTTTASDAFGGRLGERNTEEGIGNRIDRILMGHLVNPHHGEDFEKYSRNCALCAVAGALQLMGYDVEAMPRDKEWRGFGSVWDVDWSNPDNYILSASDTYRGGDFPLVIDDNTLKDVSTMVTHNVNGKIQQSSTSRIKTIDALVDKIQGWGDGAVGYLSVKWQKGTLHAVNVVNRNGKIMVCDFQSSKSMPLEQYLNRAQHPVKISQTSVVRLDNATVRENIKDLDKMVKRRKK